jgi:hypothetical protein
MGGVGQEDIVRTVLFFSQSHKAAIIPGHLIPLGACLCCWVAV